MQRSLSAGVGLQRSGSEEAPRTTFLKQRMKAQIFESYRKQRREAVDKRRRSTCFPSSDGFDDMGMDLDEEDDDDIMNEEVRCLFLP
jgi:hypothetical protein